MKKFKQLILGTILGSLGFFYANSKPSGPYNIGVKKYEEIIGIIIFSYFAYISKELISTIMLQFISGWHLTNLTHSIIKKSNGSYVNELF